MDHFGCLFAHAAPSARTFSIGILCKTEQLSDVGHLHLFKGAPHIVLGKPKALLPNCRDYRTLAMISRSRQRRIDRCSQSCGRSQ